MILSTVILGSVLVSACKSRFVYEASPSSFAYGYVQCVRTVLMYSMIILAWPQELVELVSGNTAVV